MRTKINDDGWEPIERARKLLGSFAKVGEACGVSGKAVQKWSKAGRLPRTDYTGETCYAVLIARATNGRVLRSELRPDPEELFARMVTSSKNPSTIEADPA